MKQRAIRFLLAVLTIISTSLITTKAQTILLDPPEVHIGINQGINLSMINFDPIVEQTPLIGYSGGITFRYVTEKHFGLQIETNISERGWKEKDEQYERKITYIELPFLSHFYIGNKNRFIINMGPKIGYKISENETKKTTETTTKEQHTASIHQPIDYGIVCGIGYNLKTKKAGLFQLESRAYYGLSDIFSNSKTDFFNTSNHINLSIHIGWMIQLSGE